MIGNLLIDLRNRSRVQRFKVQRLWVYIKSEPFIRFLGMQKGLAPKSRMSFTRLTSKVNERKVTLNEEL